MITSQRATLEPLARQYARKYQLPEAMVLAVIEQESDWNPSPKPRYEPGFERTYGAKFKSRFPRCRYLQLSSSFSSFGLMQVMYPCALEQGYQGEPFDLNKPETNLDFGCKLLAEKFRLAHWLPEITEPPAEMVRAALLHWNGGARPAYADEVIARIPKYVEEAA